MITNGSAKTEIKLLQKLVHQNIVKYFDSFLDISQGWNLAESSLYMEYCSHGSLFTMLNTRFISQQYFHESEIWTMAFQLINAVGYLQYGLLNSIQNPSQILNTPWSSIIHRDIKAENIFLCHNPRKKLLTLVLGDFGAAIYQIYPNGPFSKNNLQPGAWSSPEWPIFTIHSDTWLVGTVIQFCCYLQRFYHNNDKEIFLGIEKKYSNKLHNFIKKLMEPNITLRTRLNQINLDKF